MQNTMYCIYQCRFEVKRGSGWERDGEGKSITFSLVDFFAIQ